MSGTSYGMVILHVAPESARGGPLAARRAQRGRFEVHALAAALRAQIERVLALSELRFDAFPLVVAAHAQTTGRPQGTQCAVQAVELQAVAGELRRVALRPELDPAARLARLRKRQLQRIQAQPRSVVPRLTPRSG